ncbi:hypothetical protein GQ53DRAFT_813045 [Thozetella sp. PMI_491]|nr:hypothetical protein GQ53DRAFT_813045 [Thozetella sp. PMI_491]
MAENTTNYRAYATNNDYVYKEDSFPVAEKQENASQKSMRENMRQATRIELASDSTSSKSFGNIDAHAILVEALPNVRKLHSKRHGRFIHESPDLVGTFFKMIRPGVLEVLGKPQIARQEGDLKRQGPAIYLHILWRKDMSTYKFYLYVGQAIVFVRRFDDHMNPL